MLIPIAPSIGKKTELQLLPAQPAQTNPIAPVPPSTNEVVTPTDRKFTELSEKVQEQKAEQGVSFVDVWRVKIGGKPGEVTEDEMIFDMYQGEIFDPEKHPFHPCYFMAEEGKTSHTEFVIKDPDFSILKKVNRDDNVELEVGRAGVLTINKFVGTVHKFGAVFNPNGVKIFAIDKSASARNPTNAVQPSMTEAPPASDNPPPESPLDISKIEINTQDDVLTLIEQLSSASENGRKRITSTQSAFEIMTDKNGNPKFADKSNFSIDTSGKTLFNQSPMEAARQEAAMVGDSVVTRGNTTSVVSPGNEPDSGVILDLAANASIFLPGLKIIRPGALDPNSPYGAFIVRGQDIRTGETVGATVVRQAPATPHPTGIISVPQWKDIKLADPIFDGCPYTWADATKNGARVPENQAIVEGIVRIAQVITKYTRQTVGTGKWEINSWYRNPAANRAAKSGSGSRHLRGDAVDFNFPGMNKLHAELAASWDGGVAISHGSFVHIDTGAKRRWTYH